MNNTGRFLMIAALAGAISTPAVLGQSSQTAQNQQNQPNQDQYTGVSHPPPDSTIQADEEEQPPAPAPRPKPSAAVPVNPAPAPAPAAVPATSAAAAASSTSASPENDDNDPDYGIVTAESIAAAKAQAARAAAIEAKGWNPDTDIVNVVPSNPNDLPVATNITVRLSQALSTSDTVTGTPFEAVVARNVYKNGSVIIPAGSQMFGRVVFVSEGHHLGPHANLRLRPDRVILPDGTAYHLYASAVESMAPGTRTNDEGAVEANSHYKKDAVEYGAGAGTAAVVGAGLVTTHMLLQHPQEANLPKGSELIFSLTEPMALTPTKN